MKLRNAFGILQARFRPTGTKSLGLNVCDNINKIIYDTVYFREVVFVDEMANFDNKVNF